MGSELLVGPKDHHISHRGCTYVPPEALTDRHTALSLAVVHSWTALRCILALKTVRRRPILMQTASVSCKIKNYHHKYENARAHEQVTADENSFLKEETQSSYGLCVLSAFSGQWVKCLQATPGSGPFSYDFQPSLEASPFLVSVQRTELDNVSALGWRVLLSHQTSSVSDQ